jgi:peptidoglycan/xylan/chitin deacetylase (PgdA/CDA1 family)
MRIRTLLYHDVVEEGRWSSSGFDGGDAAVYKLTRTAFEAHLDRLATPGRAPDLVGAPAASHWMITFDDGGASALEVIAPALERRGWRGHFFITTGWLGAPGFLTADGVRDLAARGHIVGSHSNGHPLAMASLSRQELRREWEQSVEILSGVLGTRPTVASIPGGAYSRVVAETAGEAGIRTLFTSEPTERQWVVGNVTCYGRYTLWRGMSPRSALEFAEGRGAGRLYQRVAWDAKKILKQTCGPAYRAIRRRLLSDGEPVSRAQGTVLPPPR